MKKFKYIFIALILLFLATFIYQHYIYYKIPYNPLVELDSDTLNGFHFSENHPHPNDTIKKSTHNLNTTTRIFEYFSDLNLVPLKEKSNWDEIHNHGDIYYSGMFEFETSPTRYGTEVHINEIWLDNLTILWISSPRPKFKDGYYKIIDDKFDYEYINDLITNSQN
ncbi:hypothetical protein KQI88_05720 [Alkaliphilus sp. MSJ-5]|uniref:DUF4830 domain-containing protein n=1 Tax=Alkaliphilus flagellatus TaxID=2841507 RepID=A0ABS6G082_9FIRM|nr:hypothetical protein [Alkaliphilus flagellatus]MBU5675906.1 hypothetical protein [Alkaliphilus flagellatus]